MKIAGLVLAATAVLASPSLQAAPKHAEANAVCSAKPYKQWLPLSKLPAAETYCHKEFPVATPTCAVVKKVKTITHTSTHTDTHTKIGTTVIQLKTTGTDKVHTVTVTT